MGRHHGRHHPPRDRQWRARRHRCHGARRCRRPALHPRPQDSGHGRALRAGDGGRRDGGRWKQPDRPRHGRLGVGADRATSGEPTGRRHLRGGHRHRRRRPAPRRDGRHPVGQRDHGRSLPSSGPGPGHDSRCRCTGRDPGRFVHPRPQHAGHGGAVPAGDGGQRNAGRCEQPDRPRDGRLAVGARRHRLASDRPPGRGHLRALVQAERCVRRRRERSRRDRLPRIGERQDRHARPAQGGPVHHPLPPPDQPRRGPARSSLGAGGGLLH